MNQPDYALSEAARILGRSRSWIYLQKNQGRLQAFAAADGELRIGADELHRMQTEIAAAEASGWANFDMLDRQSLRRLAGKIGGLEHAARHSPEEIAAPMLAGQRRAWENDVDPDGTLRRVNPAEFSRRVQRLQEAHMARMQMQSVKARAARRRQEVQEQ